MFTPLWLTLPEPEMLLAIVGLPVNAKEREPLLVTLLKPREPVEPMKLPSCTEPPGLIRVGPLIGVVGGKDELTVHVELAGSGNLFVDLSVAVERQHAVVDEAAAA